MSKRLRIFVVDEYAKDRILTALVLCEKLQDVDVVQAGTALDFAQYLADGSYDVAVVEKRFSWGEGLEVLAAIRRRNTECLTLMFSNDRPESVSGLGLRTGLDGYLRKGSEGLLELPRAISFGLNQPRSALATLDANALIQLDDLPMGHAVVDGLGDIIAANHAFHELLELPLDDTLVGANIGSLGFDEHDRQLLMTSLAEGEAGVGVDLRLKLDTGRVIWVNAASGPMQGAAERRRVVMWDISRYQEAARELEQVKDELRTHASGLSQNVRGDLQRTVRHARLLVHSCSQQLDDAATKLLGAFIDSADRTSAALDYILNEPETEPRETKPAPVSLESAVVEAMRRLQVSIRQSGARVRAGVLPTLLVDRRDMVQLFHSLIDNAVKFRDPARPLRVTIRAERKAQFWFLSVKDNGIGIAAEDTDRVFDMFSQVNSREDYAGTGLGLAICRRIARQYEGDVWVESEPGVGTTFYVALRAEAAEAQKTELAVQFNGKPVGRVTVLNISNKSEVTRAALGIPQLSRDIGDRTIKDIQIIEEGIVNIVA